MKIKWGALAVDGRGKLGGHVAADGAGGSYLRTKVTPNNPQTMAQAKARSQFGIISQKWNGLTEAQRTAWNKAVDAWKTTDIFGDLKQPSGKELFQRLNNQLKDTSFSFLSTPPSKLSITPYVLTGMNIVLPSDEIARLPTTTFASVSMQIESSGPVNNGVTNIENLMRVILTRSGASQGRSETYAAYVQKFGEPLIGQLIYFRINIIVPSGQKMMGNLMLATITP